MCGLFGFVREFPGTFQLRDYLMNFTLAGTMRGTESVGYYFGSPSKGQIEKFPVSGATLAYSKVMTPLNNLALGSTVLIGHHRASTHGEVNTANCHPFTRSFEDRTIIGAHNGVISSFSRVEAGREFVVDSDWAMFKLAQLGDEAYKEFDGAFAFSYLDVKGGKFVLACNSLRPMCYAFVTKKNAMLYASEWGMLQCVASRNDIDLEDIYVMDALEKHEFQIGNPRNVTKGTVPEFQRKTNIATRPTHTRDYRGRYSAHDYGSNYGNGSLWPHENYVPSNDDYDGLTASDLDLVDKPEVEFAKSLGLLGEIASVYVDKPESLTERSTACQGVAVFEAECESAIVRGITKRNWWKIANSKSFTAKIIGARWTNSIKDPREKEFRVIVGEPIVLRLEDVGKDAKKQMLIDDDLAAHTRTKAGLN